MRIARLVGLSQDGRSLIVATPSGEELAVPVDERLHAALRGDQPRLGQLEIEMENALGPRDIQARIRSGQSLEEVGRVAGIPMDRVERFAAPVLAEREHVALMAMSSSVRRRGETSGHRLLRIAVTERLVKRGVDIDSVDWDSYRREDGRWTVTASYRSGESSRQAVFVFDPQGRFSVADDDEARWLLGEQSSLKGPQPGRRRPIAADDDESEPDTEPTLDLSDELALVRVIQRPDDVEPTQQAPDLAPASDATTAVDQMATVRDLYPVADPVSSEEAEPLDDDMSREQEHESALEILATMLDEAQDSGAIYGGLSDASAVPAIDDNSGWEPGIVIDYPVEPSPEAAVESDDQDAETPGQEAEPSDQEAEPSVSEAEQEPDVQPAPEAQPVPEAQPAPEAQPVPEAQPESEAEQVRPEVGAAVEAPAPEDEQVDPADAPGDEDESKEPTHPSAATTATKSPEPGADEQEQAQPAPRPAGKRKRAAVPSWDEIMFGGPPRTR